MDPFDQLAPGLLNLEGGAAFTNNPADRGGPTRFGVTAAKLGEFRHLGRDATAAEVAALQEPEALTLYRLEFWLRPCLDRVAKVSPRIAAEMLESGVNLGAGWPPARLQAVLNLLNRRGRDYADLKEDGQIGRATLGALTALIQQRSAAVAERVVLNALNGEQYAHYKALITAGGPNGSQEEFAVGWLANRLGFS